MASEAVDPVLVAALRRVGTLAAESDPLAALRFLIGRFQDATARRVPTTPDALAELVADLAAVSGRTVLDPACGMGGLLAAARSRGATRLAGQDTNAATCRIAAARLIADGGVVELAVGDSLRADGFPGRLFGAVVCEPPFGERAWGHDELGTDLRWQHGLPPRGEPELAWVQHCLSHVEPGGRVVVVMPAAATDRRAGRRIRRNLVRSGALRAVVGFPGETGRSVDLWVLQRPRPHESPPARLLFVVAEPDDVAGHWQRFLDGEPVDGPAQRAVTPVDLLDDEVDLSPARHVLPRTDDGDLATLRRALETSYGGYRRCPCSSAAPRIGRRRPSATSSGQLPSRCSRRRRGRPSTAATFPCSLRATSPRPAARPVAPRAIRRWWSCGPVTSSCRPSPGGTRRYGLSVTATSAPSWVRACCACDPTRRGSTHTCWPAACESRVLRPVRAATSLSRSDVRRLSLPLLPIDEQRRLGAAFAGLAAFDEALRRCAAAAEAYLQAAASALAEGRVGPEP